MGKKKIAKKAIKAKIKVAKKTGKKKKPVFTDGNFQPVNSLD